MVNKIYDICEDIINITENEIEEIKKIYEEQLTYSHPFKMSTSKKQTELGEYNKLVLEKLIEIREILSK